MSNIITGKGDEIVTIQNDDDTPLLTVEVNSSTGSTVSADYQLPIRPVSGSTIIVEHGSAGNTDSFVVDHKIAGYLILTPTSMNVTSTSISYRFYQRPIIRYNNITNSIKLEHNCVVTKGNIDDVPIGHRTATIKSIQYVPGTTIARITYNNKIIVT